MKFHHISPYIIIYINFNFPYHSCQSCNNHVRNKSLPSSKKFHLYFEISNRNEPDDVPVKKKKRKKKLSNSLVTSFTEAARARVYTYRRNCIYPESYLRWAKSHWGILRAGSDLGIACAPTFSSSSNLSPPTAEPARIQAGRMQIAGIFTPERCTPFPAKHPLASFGIFIISPTSFSYTPNA